MAATQTAVADDKKSDPAYPVAMNYEYVDPKTGKVTATVKDVRAVIFKGDPEKDDKVKWFVQNRSLRSIRLEPGSRLVETESRRVWIIKTVANVDDKRLVEVERAKP